MKNKILILLFFLLLILSCKGKNNNVDENATSTTFLGKNEDDIKLKSISFENDFGKNTIEYYSSEAAVSDKEGVIKEGKDPFVITDYGPVDVLPEEMKKPVIYVSFNYPIIPLAKLGEVMRNSNILKIEPEIKGVYRFYGTRMISFEPEEEVLPQREYTVTINKSLKSMGGKSLTGDNKFSFKTEYLKILNYYPSGDDIPPSEAKKISITFSYPVNINLIKSYLRIESNGKNYNYNIRAANKDEVKSEEMRKMTVICEVKENFSFDSEVNIILKKGARSEKDYLGIPDDLVYSFRTLKPFNYSYYSNYSYYEDKVDSNPVYIYFSHPIDEKTVADSLRVILPDVDFDIKNHFSVYSNYIKLFNLPVKFNSEYTISISKNLKDIYGRYLEKEVDLNIKVPDAASYYYFPNEGDKMLESQYPAKVSFEIQNIFNGNWKIGAIDNPYNRWREEELVPYDFSKYNLNHKYIEVIDLKPYLNSEGKGFVGISWYFKKKSYYDPKEYYGEKVDLNLQVTDLGVSVRYGYNKMVLIVASLSTGKPIENAKVQLKSYGVIKKETVTDKNGFATFLFNEGEYKEIFKYISTRYEDRPRIRVEYGMDKIEFVPNYSHNVYKHGIYNTERPDNIDKVNGQTFIFTDRGLYKPGETVTFRGIDKNLQLGRYTPYVGEYNIEVSEQYSDSAPFFTDTGNTTSSGGFYGSFKIPENLEPGYYYINYSRKNHTESISFQVAYFRRVSFQTSLKIPDLTFYKGDSINATLSATYLAGGSLANAKYDYFWTKRSTYFKPEGAKWGNYRFGTYDYQSEETIANGTGKLSGDGSANLKVDAKGDFVKGLTYSFQCYANVTDIDRQEIGTSRSVIVHPASFYLGLKFRSGNNYWSAFVSKGENVTVDYVLVTPDGKEYEPKNNKIKIKLSREEWKLTQQKGVYGRINTVWDKEVILESQQTISASSYSGSFNIKPEKVGEYLIEAESTDEKGRVVFTKFYFYSTGSDMVNWWGNSDSDSINLILDKDIYNPGDVARIMVQTPLQEGKYILTIEREGILEEKVIDIKGTTTVLEIPVKEEYIPVFYVALTGFSKRTEAPPKEYGEPDLGKPKGYFGIKKISVSTEKKEIQLTISSNKSNYRPGEEAIYKIKATRDGKPLANTEITFLAVDRGVLDLINYHVPNPLSFFYASYKFPLGVIGADSRSMLIDPVLYERKNLYGGDDFSKLEERKDFTPTAVFELFLMTDENGEATVKFKFPDNLTTYRCTALAVKDDFYGIKESEIRVNNPINVRMALPRRLRLRDTTYAGVVITNLSDKEQEVIVKAESDLLLIDEENEKKVKIKPDSTMEVAFKIAAVKDGIANIVFITRSEILNEKLIDKIIVERPINKESFTTIGNITDQEKEEGLIIPSNILSNYGGLSFKLASTRLNTLSGSIEYLYDYPYLCLEQRSSKLFPVVLFKDIITNFIDIKNPKKLVEDELKVWADYQNSDGGFPYWLEGLRKSGSYISIKVAKFLYYAKKNGFNIPSKIKIDRLLDFIKNYNYEYEKYNLAYSYYVLSLFGENIVAKAKSLMDTEKDRLGISGYCMLGIAFLNNNQKDLANICFKKLKNLIKVGTQTIDLVEPYEYGYYFDSQVSQLAFLLMFYQKISKDNDMITKITNTIINRQKAGYWDNTYTTEWVIESFYYSFGKENAEKTNFIAKIAIDGKDIFNSKFKGFKEDNVIKYLTFDNELKDFERDSLLPLNIKKDGEGTLYYTITMRYSLPSEVIKQRDEGFSVFSEIKDLNGKIVKSNELKLGETYKMRVVVSTSKKRNFVALRCPIPSGAEIIDSSFVTSPISKEKKEDESSPDEYDESGEYYDYYYEVGPVQKIYDNEVQYFFDDFYHSREEVEFIFRVTTPGIYPTPPVYVECMYEEEVFGRDNGKLWIVKRQ
ncbi:MAG TPA: MG2 domain-containing protein [Spirochaetota bacterium]|mgnify:FL=1|nr:MG2 domain-containing protein [Spirochaetota bacterium]